MKEKEFIEVIKTTLNSDYIGDDCAYLQDMGIVISQDSLVEGVHFSRAFMAPYQLGFKSVAVNISDICASGAEPKYLTVALSLPDDIDEEFIKNFYNGAKAASGAAKIVGGDITGADKIYISVTAIGSCSGRKIATRSGAKSGQKIVIAGCHGSSAVGLDVLQGKDNPFDTNEKSEFINAHLMPKAQLSFSKRISTAQKNDYAMMDTSDGLADALCAIAEQSGVLLEIDFDKIPHIPSIVKLNNYEEYVLYGGEDYGLVATVDNPQDFTVIGEVKEGHGVKINYNNRSEVLTKFDIEKKIYNHFKE